MNFEFSHHRPRGNACYRNNFFTPAHRRIYLDPFHRILLVTSTQSFTLEDSEVIRQVATFPGYEAHKFVQHRDWHQSLPFHLYVRFATEKEANAAELKLIEFAGTALQIALVSSCLFSLFELQLELKIQFMWTAAYVDRRVKDFDEPALGEILPKHLADYGNPGVVFSKSVKLQDTRVDHAYISFASPAEALGACINFGQWWRATLMDGNPVQHEMENYFRVLLHRGPHFRSLLNLKSEKYLELDYFFQDGDWDIDLNTELQGLGYDLEPVYDPSPEGYGGNAEYQQYSTEGYGGNAEDQQYSPDNMDLTHLAQTEQSSSPKPEVGLSTEEVNNYDSERTDCQQFGYTSQNYDTNFATEVSVHSDQRTERINRNQVRNEAYYSHGRDVRTEDNQYGSRKRNSHSKYNNRKNYNSEGYRMHGKGNSRDLDRNEVYNCRRGSSWAKSNGSRDRHRQTANPYYKTYKDKVYYKSEGSH